GEAELFLGRLYGLAPDDLWVLVWVLPEKRSHWFRVLDLADAAALAAGHQGNVYFQVALASKDHGVAARCPADQVACLVALHADIDIAGPPHKKPNLPPTEADARALLDDMPLKPTVVVHSGHGLQAYWLLKEPLALNSPEDREKAHHL